MRYWIFLIAANIPVYLGIGWVLFGSWSAWMQTVIDAVIDFFAEPDGYDPIDHGGDPFAFAKFVGFLILCAAAVYFEHLAISKWIL